MKLSNINFDKGASFAPLSSLKCAGSGVGSWDIISSVLGWGFDTANNIYTNDTNQSIARATNQANKEINDEQLAWAREQYEMEKAENRYLVDQAYQRDIEQRENERKYNSPAMQRQRLLAAGINPTLAMYGSGGSASAGASSAVRSQVGQNAHANQPNAIPMQNGFPVQPITGASEAFSRAGEAALEYEKFLFDMSARKQELRNDTLKIVSEMIKNDSESGKLKQEAGRILRENLLFDSTYDDQVRTVMEGANKLAADAHYTQSMAENMDYLNSIAPEMTALEKQKTAAYIAVSAADVALKASQKNLTDQEYKTEVERTGQEYYKRMDLPKQLHNDNAIRVATYKQIMQQAKKLKAETSTEKWRTIDVSKHSMKQGDRPLEDYFNYARDAFENVDMNNRRGFFRAR